MQEYSKKDFSSGQDPRWCPGCGDYAILAAVQSAMTKLGKKKEEIVFISGIGCSSRFPYYMNTFGMHTIHGRAPAIATGLKIHNPDLSVWVVTGDGDSLSIGGNHLIHALRRNINLNILLFNNEIYGLTKGQYSPTSKKGTVTKSSPFGSLDRSFVPGALALGAGATFFARSIDTDVIHMQEVMLAAASHQGASLIELYQNCIIFNNGAHDKVTNRQIRDDFSIRVEHGKPLVFGKEKNKGLVCCGHKLKVVTFEPGNLHPDLIIHDENDLSLANQLVQMKGPDLPVALGVIYRVSDAVYDEELNRQIEEVKVKRGKGDMQALLLSGETWEVKEE